MIKLTRANGRDVWVEPSAIVMVESDGMKTTVVLSHGTMLLVKEDVQHVLAERLKRTVMVESVYRDDAGAYHYSSDTQTREFKSGFVR